MRKKTLYTLLSIGMICMSCSSYLDEDPQSALTEEDAFNTVGKLKNNALLSIYNYIGGSANSQGLQGTDRGVYDLNSLTTDEQIIPIRGGDWEDNYLWYRLYFHEWTSGEGPFNDTWNYLFKVIVMTNEGIERIENFKKSHEADSATLDAYTAELRALRAMFYFYAMDLWGRVPLVTSTQVRTSEMTLADRRTTFLFIVKELQEAAPLLSQQPSPNKNTEYYGRMTRPVAYFILAKLLLNAEIYYDNDWTDNERPNAKDIIIDVKGEQKNAWEAVVHYCSRIGMRHELAETYSSNFSVHNDESRENIFVIPTDPVMYSNRYNYFFRSRHYSHGSAIGGTSENGPCATVSTMKAFGYGTDSMDKRALDCFYLDTVYYNDNVVYEDDGVTPLVYHPMAVTMFDLSGEAYEKTAGARLRKYEVDPTARADGRLINNDIVLFRYADVLLMQAEALIRLGRADEAADPFYQVRKRGSGLESDNQPVTLDMIYHERLLELMWEGWRRNDMIRFDTFHQPYDLKEITDMETDRHTIVFPIPANLMQMHPDWKQNPGY